MCLICNPRLVQTGLDLVAFPTLVFLEPDYSSLRDGAGVAARVAHHPGPAV